MIEVFQGPTVNKLRLVRLPWLIKSLIIIEVVLYKVKPKNNSIILIK